MKRAVLFIAVLLVAASGIVACSSDADTTADGGVVADTTTSDTNSLVPDTSGPASIYGDWFLCETETCDKVTYRGWGFHPDGKHPAFFAEPPYLEPDETYCSSWKGDNRQFCKVQGDTLIVIDPDKKEWPMKILKLTQDRLILQSDLDTTYYQRVDPPRVSGECDPQGPWLCPTSSVGSTNSDVSCSWDYPCDTGNYRLVCNKADIMLWCECWEDKVKKNSFPHPQACTDMTLESSVEVANQGCGWQVWIP